MLGMCVCMCIMCGCVFSGELKWVKLIFMTASKKLLRFYIFVKVVMVMLYQGHMNTVLIDYNDIKYIFTGGRTVYTP